MSVTPFRVLSCPLDGSPLQRQGAAWRYAAGSSLGIACCRR